MPETILCIGCGATVPDIDSDGPAHDYIGASPGCWAAYMEVMAKEYGEFDYPECHRLTVDAYSVQHPGTPSRKSIQSVAAHLIGLCAVLECGLDSQGTTRAIGKAVERSSTFTWLEPPSESGSMTIFDVLNAEHLGDHEKLVRLWAQSVWTAWSEHHALVRSWGGMSGHPG